jgi:hypothetical protein
MAGRDRPPGTDPDDWFGDIDPVAPLRSRADTRSRQALAFERQEPGAADDWLDGERGATRPEGRAGFSVKLSTLLVGATVVVVLLVLGGLELGGVFSGSGKHPATTPTTTPAITTTQTPTTTPVAPTRTPRALAAPSLTLKPGAQGAQVKLLQRALKRLGYSVGVVDGVYGSSTQAALTRFQSASALTADGVLGPATLQALKKALRKSHA